jgi:hypothetical protein
MPLDSPSDARFRAVNNVLVLILWVEVLCFLPWLAGTPGPALDSDGPPRNCASLVEVVGVPTP